MKPFTLVLLALGLYAGLSAAAVPAVVGTAEPPTARRLQLPIVADIVILP